MTTGTLSTLFANARTIAVVGLSAKMHRASFGVARYMQAHGYRIIPINPKFAGTYILEEQCFSSLTEATQELKKSGIQIDIVNCFRKSADIEPVADEAIALGLPCLWMQLGISNDGAANRLTAAGVMVVMDRCIKIDHMDWLAATRQ